MTASTVLRVPARRHPPGHTPPPQEPRPANLTACRSAGTVRLSWGAVTVNNPAAGYALAGWRIEWGVSGSGPTQSANLAVSVREQDLSLSTGSAWTITLSATLDSGNAGTQPASLDIPTGDPVSGQCPAPPPVVPSPSPALTCAASGVSGSFMSWTANTPAGQRRAAEYEIEWRHGTGAWQPAVIVVHGSQVNFTAAADPGYEVGIRIRIRGRGRQQNEHLGVWSAWSPWSVWSSWADHDTPTCPFPVPPAPAVTLNCGHTQFDGAFTPWGIGDSDREAEYEAQWRTVGSAAWTPIALTGIDTDSDGQYEWTQTDLDAWRIGTGADADDPPDGLQADEWHTAASLRDILQSDRERLEEVRDADPALTVAQAITAAAEGDVGCYPPGHSCLAPNARCLRTGS